MTNPIIESGMSFIAENTYHIEKSAAYQGVGDGIRSVEFVRKKGNTLLFVEAKTTFPNPENSPEQYTTEICEICDKFIHSLNLFSSVKVGVHYDTLPPEFILQETISLSLVLVISRHKDEWCDEVKAELNKALPQYFKKI
jgi:hypothetical protein